MDRPAPAYIGKEPYVFVSYSHEDEELVYPEVRWLQEKGFNVWWDEGISPGAEWRDEVTHALQDCALILYFITPDSVESGQCRREINFGLDQYQRPVLAVHLLEVELPDSLGLVLSDRQAILKPGLSQEEYERKLITTIASHLAKPLPEIGKARSNRVLVSMRMRQLWGVATAALVLGSVATYLVVSSLALPEKNSPSFQFSITVSDVIDNVGYPEVSRDGKRFVLFGRKDGPFTLYTREIDSFTLKEYEGTRGSDSWFLSHDGNWVAYFNDDKLFKIRIEADSSPIQLLKLVRTSPVVPGVSMTISIIRTAGTVA